MNPRELDDKTMVSGQISPADVPALKAMGVTMIVCNRPDGEEPGQPTAADVEQAAEDNGLDFRFVPIVRGIGPSDAESMQEALAAAKGKVLAYCRSGTRSALTWTVARREDGASVEELQAAASRAGVDLTPVAHLL
jgi:uncharacterized protein (TIGR01244 family)